eukprot:TRINITY_DN9148_c0_g1_i1.p1 TRINITY_DN9148_c0_g1~~TRINITY_DN9148_c0_g1_i1.p1  ORF type:complete len:161 (-),score=62.47 TRINITY_DN9148_c0_g1_i1:4-486(-)
MDRITQLQRELERIAALHYTSVGVLQRDAPAAADATSEASGAAAVAAAAAAATGDDNEPVAARAAFAEQTRTLARELVHAHRFVDELLASLPPLSADATGVADSDGVKHAGYVRRDELSQLDAESREADAELRAVIAEADAWLEQLRSALHLIGDDRCTV